VSGVNKRVVRRRVTRIDAGREPGVEHSTTTARVREDNLAAEEPLEIRLNGRSLAVTMRTPGHDVELAHGFLVSEGVIHHREDVVTARYCSGVNEDGENLYNVLDIQLAAGVQVPQTGLERHVYTSSSCGVCGKASIDAVRTSSPYDVARDDVAVDPSRLITLPDRLRQGQQIFDQTGGLHAAGLFAVHTGDLLVVREDVGRHNAVDKAIGWALLDDRLPLNGTVLMVSGRASFELVQKAWLAGIPVLAAVSAPSSLAAELAEEAGITLIGFLRGTSMTAYSRADRVSSSRLAGGQR
jgi:FdhD protein